MIDTSKPITNPTLVEALELLHKENTPENQNKVLDEIVMRAHFLAPVVMLNAPAGSNIKSAPVQFQLIHSQDGRTVFPAFTDWTELRKLCGPKDQQTMVLTFDNYASMILSDNRADGFVINPFGFPLTLDRDFIALLAKQKKEHASYTPDAIQKDTKVLLGEPKDCPALIDALRLAVAGMPEVEKLYLRLMSRPGQAQPGYLIVVDHSGSQDIVFRAIADAARPHLSGVMADMVAFDSDLGQAATKNAKPFFSRQK